MLHASVFSLSDAKHGKEGERTYETARLLSVFILDDVRPQYLPTRCIVRLLAFSSRAAVARDALMTPAQSNLLLLPQFHGSWLVVPRKRSQ